MSEKDIRHIFTTNQLIFLNEHTKTNIPLYYALINHQNIFDIFAHYISNKKSKNDFYTDFMRIYVKKFVAFSLAFNIINVAFFTNKYIDLINLFFKNIRITENDVKLLFETDTNNKLLNLKQFFTYVKGIHILPKKCASEGCIPCQTNFFSLNYSENINENNITDKNECYNNIHKLIQFESGTETDISSVYQTNRIIQNFAKFINTLNDDLDDISRIFKFPEYKKIFLMSILKYRLKNRYITGTWAFSDYIIDSIKTRVELFDAQNTYISNLYLENKPVVYEYLMTTYKNKTYGNCMENTILQILKILFYDDQYDKYNVININGNLILL